MEQIQPFDSEESISGCESGWTLYLQHDSIDQHPHGVFSWKHAHDHDQEHEDDDDDYDDDDDMSMVSDASSGPPHFQEHQDHEEEEEYFNNDNNGHVFCDHPPLTLGIRKRRKLFKQPSFHSQYLPAASLDDTASSPFFSFSSKDVEVCNKESSKEDDNSFGYSLGHSTTYFEMV